MFCTRATGVALMSFDSRDHYPSARDYAGTSPFEWGGEDISRYPYLP